MNARVFVFLGPPGSGKGTQAKLLAEKLGIPHVSLGDILREEVRSGSEVGQKIKALIEAGKLAPDELTISLARKRVEQKDCEKGFIFDGFPRSQAQAEALDEMLREKSWNLEKVFYLAVDEEEVVNRLSQRRSCKNCGAVYHLVNNPPKIAGKCNLCGGELYLRHDDEPQVIRTRFEVYERETMPLIERYLQQGVLVKVKASGTINEVFARLWEALK
ncbi:MAG: adenylate kinase [Candidatus Margulisiibacteriota bacterium]